MPVEAIWDNAKAVVKLAKEDEGKTATKAVKRFLKECLKPAAYAHLTELGKDEELGEDEELNFLKSLKVESECINNLTAFAKAMGKLAKKDYGCVVVNYALDLWYGHSKLREIMLKKEHRSALVRQKVVVIFCQLCTDRIDYCLETKENFVDFVLSCYDATLTIEDQSLLNLLSLIELSGHSLQRYRPFIWGPNGAVFYAAKHAQKLAFLKLPTIDEIFAGFNDHRLQHSLTNFPIELELTYAPVAILEQTLTNDGYRINLQYDPRFLLPMFYHFMSADSIVKCHKFIAYGGLSYTIAALSSMCVRLRIVAYRTLARFYAHLEAASYPKERHLWLGLLDHLRSGLTEPEQRLESIHTVFFVNLIEILNRPLSVVFPTVRRYLLAAQSEPYNYRNLPSLYWICLHQVTTTNAHNYMLFQKFALLWIYHSLRTDRDVRLCHYRRVFADVMAHYNSPLLADECRPLIMKLITRAAEYYEGVKVLCFDCAIFAWAKHQLLVAPMLAGAARQNSAATASIEPLYKLVVALWSTALANHRLRKEAHEPYVLYKAFTFEVVDLLAKIVNKATDLTRITAYRNIVADAIEATKDERLANHVELAVLTNLPENL